MADVTFRRGVEANLPTSGMATEGCVYQSTDTGNMYVGSSQGTLIPVNRSPYYGTCPTQASTNAKVVTLDVDNDNFTMKAGVMISVLFSYANTASSPTLNVNSKGAVAVKIYGTTNVSASPRAWEAGEVVTFVHNGSYWMMVCRKTQSDWNQTDSAAVDFIKNKPTVPTINETLSANYGVCSSSASTVAKTVTVNNSDFELSEGVRVKVKFSSTNTAESPTLAVNGTAAKPIVTRGTKSVGKGSQSSWEGGSVVELTYDGISWVIDGWLNDNDVYHAGGSNVTVEDLDPFEEYDSLLAIYNSSSTSFSTALIPTNQNEVFIDIRYYERSSLTNFYLFGYVGGTAVQYRYGLVQPTSTSTSKFQLCWRDKGDAYLESTVARVASHVYHIKARLHNGTATLYVLDETTGVSDTVTATYDTTNVNTLMSYIRLFAGGSSNYYCGSGTYVYSAKMDCDGKPMLNYIPMRRKSDEMVGFLDTVSGSFLSSDSGNVTANKLNEGSLIDRPDNHIIKVSTTVDDSNFVHKTGTETVGGEKTFTDNLKVGAGKVIDLGVGNDEGVYIQASSDSNGKQIAFGDDEDDTEVRLVNVAAPIDGLDAANKAYVDAAIEGGSSGITLPLAINQGGTGRTTARGAEYEVTPKLATELSTDIDDSYRIPFLSSLASLTNGRFAGWRRASRLWDYILSKITSLLGISYNSNDEGVPLAPTAASGTNTTQIATTAFVQDATSGLAETSDIPTKTSDLTNDGGSGTSQYVEESDLATVATTGSYNDLLDKPTIPSTSGFAVDSEVVHKTGTEEITGDKTFKGADVILQNTGTSSAATPNLVFQRGTSTDGYIDWSIGNNSSGQLVVSSRSSSTTTERVRFSGSSSSQQMLSSIDIKAPKFITDGGTSQQYVKGDGTLGGNATQSVAGLLSAADKTKLDGIAAGAEVNVQSDWNQTDDTADDYIKGKPTIPTVPTNVSAFINDAGYITTNDIPEGAAASTTTPKMDGTASVGTELAFARGDHRHPSDTSRVPTARTVNGYPLSSDVTLNADDVGALPSSTVIPTVGTLNTNNTTSQSVNSSESFSGAIKLHKVSKTGNYNDLIGKPNIPSMSDINGKADKVANATSGNFAALDASGNLMDSNKSASSFLPSDTVIPTVNDATLTIQKNSSSIGTFSANAATNETINISVPTTTNELTNNSGFITENDLPGVFTYGSDATPSVAGTDGLVPAPTFGERTKVLRGDGSWVSLPSASSSSPLMDGTAAVGTSTSYSRGDHVHPTDTSRAADNAVVHRSGAETVSGAKTFTSNLTISGNATLNFETSQDAGIYVEATVDTNNVKELNFCGIEDDSQVRLTNVATPVQSTDAVNKVYVDNLSENGVVKLNGYSGSYGIHQRSLCAFALSAGGATMTMTSFTTTGGSSSKSPIMGFVFPIGCKIYYHGETEAFAATTSFTSKEFYASHNSVNARYSAVTGSSISLSSLSASTVYLRVMVANGYWSPYYKQGAVSEIIVTSDHLVSGGFYIYLGKTTGSNSYTFQLEDNNPLYYYDGTKLVDWATYIAQQNAGATYVGGAGINISGNAISIAQKVWSTELSNVSFNSQRTTSLNPSSPNQMSAVGLYKISAMFTLGTGNTLDYATEAQVLLQATANGYVEPITLVNTYVSLPPVRNINPNVPCYFEGYIYLSSGTLVPSLTIIPNGYVWSNAASSNPTNGRLTAQYIGVENIINV